MDPLTVTLPLILFLGIASSFYDSRKQIIPNQLVTPVFFIALLVYTIFILTTEKLNFSFVYTTSSNLLVSIIVALALWKKKWWYGGDAKLFITYALLVPVSVYQRGYVPYFPALVLLMNTFIPIALLTSLPLFRHRFPVHALANAALSVFALAWLPALLVSNTVLQFLLLLALSSVFATLPFGFWVQALLIVYRLVTDTTLRTFSFWFHFLLYTFLLLAITQYIATHANSFATRKRPHDGDILAEDISSLKKGAMITAQDARLIDQPALVYDKIPFAPCLFFGVLLTIVSHGIFLSLITSFI
ncbi:prepilin peptidase [Candidatus Woesearchaeota archaeon]|nr:prepilin peptidase [Candidatus Woesearchaeota archaeon]